MLNEKSAKTLIYLENAEDTRRSTEHIAHVCGCSYAVAHQIMSVLRAGDYIRGSTVGNTNKKAYTLTDDGRALLPQAKQFLEQKAADEPKNG